MELGNAYRSLCPLLISLHLMIVYSAAFSDHSSHSPTVFINLNDIKKGNKIPFSLPKKDFSTNHFLPRHVADSIPFSSHNLAEIKALFAGSPKVNSIEATIDVCEHEPLVGETKICATSMESMLDFVFKILDIDPISGDRPPKILTSTFKTEHREVEQKYTIISSPEEIPLTKMVGCHTLPYPYTVALCHNIAGENRVFKMLMRGENGDLVDMIAACHIDTLKWEPQIPVFAALGTHPGDPVCHVFAPHGNFLWIRNDNNGSVVSL